MPRRASNGASDTATVSITVVDVNDAPVFVDPTPADGEVLEYEAGMSVELTLAADDPEADAITYGVDPLFDAASLDTATGAFSWPVSWEDAGDHALTLLATDGTNNISRAITVRVTIVDMDDDAVPDDLEASLGLDPTTADTDADGISDADELGADLSQPADTDADATIDALDEDSDDDGLLDADEAGDDDLATAPVDTDADATPDFQDADSDDDGVGDAQDNCPRVDNADQADTDQNGVGDACTDDGDGDGVGDDTDNCPAVANPDQADTDADGTGDACDADGDGDGVDDAVDNCPDVDNAEQADLDADATGDACDDDDDGDMVADADDACPLEAGDGADGCPAGGTSSGAADEGCGCSSSQPAGVPGNALVLARGGLALLWRRRRRRS